METAYDMCKEIDPQIQTPNANRTVTWIKSKFRDSDFKALCAKAYSNYKASGNQDASDPQLEFAKFCNGDPILMYAFVLFGTDDEMQDLLGKELASDVGSKFGYRRNW